jgi:hypothetical protein
MAGFLLVNNHAEYMLIDFTAWFDNKRRHLPTWLANLLMYWCWKHKKIKKNTCKKQIAAPTQIGRPTIHSAGVSGKGN